MKTFALVLMLVPTLLAASAAVAADPFGFPADANFPLTPGRTYLDFMRQVVRPRINDFARQGYKMRDANAMANAFRNVVPKVKTNATAKIVIQNGRPTRVPVLTEQEVG